MFRLPLLVSLAAAFLGGYLAYKKGRNQYLWGALCFIFPLLIVLILLLPPQLTQGVTKKCPHCGKIVYKGDTVCSHCRRELPIELVQCRHCGSFVPEKEYCSQCHRKLGA